MQPFEDLNLEWLFEAYRNQLRDEHPQTVLRTGRQFNGRIRHFFFTVTRLILCKHINVFFELLKSFESAFKIYKEALEIAVTENLQYQSVG